VESGREERVWTDWLTDVERQGDEKAGVHEVWIRQWRAWSHRTLEHCNTTRCSRLTYGQIKHREHCNDVNIRSVALWRHRLGDVPNVDIEVTKSDRSGMLDQSIVSQPLTYSTTNSSQAGSAWNRPVSPATLSTLSTAIWHLARVSQAINTTSTQQLSYLEFYLWSPYVIKQTIYIFILSFVLSSFFFLFSSPNLSGWRLEDGHTSTHGVALVRI